MQEQHEHHVDGDGHVYNLGETPAWEACGKVIVLERADFWEFVVSSGSRVCDAFVRRGRGEVHPSCRCAALTGALVVVDPDRPMSDGRLPLCSLAPLPSSSPSADCTDRPSRPIEQMCNVLFAGFSLFVVLYRSKQLAAVQYRKLAARIGIVSG
jgi:hypothetical protein